MPDTRLGDSTLAKNGCSPCEVALTAVGRFGDKGDPILLEKIPRVVMDSRRRIYAAPSIAAASQRVLIYDLGGRQLGQLGRVGPGPGEYQRVVALAVGSGDSLVLAREGYGIEVFDPSGKPVRSTRTPIAGIVGLIHRPDGSLLISGDGRTESSVGLPFHIVEVTGEIRRSFGHRPYAPVDEPSRLVRPALNGEFWIVEKQNYVVERLDTLGAIRTTIGGHNERFGASFTTDTIYRMREAARRSGAKPRAIDVTPQLVEARDQRSPRLLIAPAPEIIGFSTDGDSLIWVLLHVPVENWRDIHITWDPRWPGEPRESDDLLPIKYESVLDVIDARTGELRGRKTLPGYWALARHGTVVRFAYDATGRVIGEVFDVRLTQQTTNPSR